MPIIFCPECNSAISDTAKFCPHCGYSKKVGKRNHSLLKILIIIETVIIIVLSLLSINLYTELLYFSETTAEENLFSYNSKDKYDPYGFSGENNILGADISSVIGKFTADVDYSLNKNDVFCAYTFNEPIEYPIGENAHLIIYTDVTSTKITLVEYAFRMTNNGAMLSAKSSFAVEDLTDQYNVEPTFTYTNSDFVIEHTSWDTFRALLRQEYKSLYHATWKTDNDLEVSLYIPYTTDIKDLDCSISYSNE